MSHQIQDRHRFTEARRYSDALFAESKRSKTFHLISGSHYDGLAEFLRRKGSTANVLHDRTPFQHIITKTVVKDKVEPRFYSSHSQPSEFSLKHTGEDAQVDIIFLRGYISPPWLDEICEQTNFHPELFRRHLHFMDRNDFYDLPALPSGSLDILRVRITTICTRSLPLTLEEIRRSRREEEAYITQHQRGLSELWRSGDSIVRRYAVHNEMIFTIGQDISCAVNKTKRGWMGLIWMDAGRDLYEQTPGPWTTHGLQGVPSAHSSLPVIQHRPSTDSTEVGISISAVPGIPSTTARGGDDSATVRGARLAQSAALLPVQTGTSLDPSLIPANALYAMSDIIAFAAASEKQFLNMIRVQLEKDLRLYIEFMEASLENISHAKILLDEHLGDSLQTLAGLRMHGGPNWPYTLEGESTDGKRTGMAGKAIAELIGDYEALVEEMQILKRRCIEGSHLITNRALLDDARKAAEQNTRVGRLTTLAFLFIPTSFVASFFGMNFSEFGQGNLRLWVGVVVMAVFIIGSGVVSYFDDLLMRWKDLAEQVHTAMT